MNPRFLLSLFLSVLLSGCIGTTRIIDPQLPFQAECFNALIDNHFDSREITYDPDERDDWKDDVDERIHFLAHAFELQDDLQELIRLNRRGENRDMQDTLRRRLLKAVDLTSLEVSAIASGLDCEEDKSVQLADFLDRQIRNQERKLTVAAIITGAVISTGIAIAVLSGMEGTNPVLQSIGLAGGLAEVYMGFKALSLRRKIEVDHPINIIQMVIEEDNSKGIFSPAVWFYLNAPTPGMERSLREKLLARWDAYGRYSDEDFTMFLGDKGLYTANMLDARSGLLEQLSSQVFIMKQDIMLFMSFLHEF